MNRMPASFWCLALGFFVVVPGAPGGEISGVVKMPEICSPSISPAVVYLDSSQSVAPVSSASVDVVLVNQRDLRFTPRVQVIPLGGRIRFGNQDGENHNVHVVSPGFAFNQSMAPGQFQEFTPDHAGVVRLACDIHLHMRGFVVVSPTPWAAVCSREGRFRLREVPDGRYTLHAWHEMGDPTTTEVVVKGGVAGPVSLSLSTKEATAGQGKMGASVPARPWADVLDRISVALAASGDAAVREGGLDRARKFADDAYWGEFEASDLETAIRKFLGFARAGVIERRFRTIRAAVASVAASRETAGAFSDECHALMLDLITAVQELNAKGVIDSRKVFASQGELAYAASGSTDLDPRELMTALKRGFHRVREVADGSGRDQAAGEWTSVYMTEFEPIERYLMGRDPQAIRPFELRWNAIRGEISAGLSGEPLETRLAGLGSDVERTLGLLEARPMGGFGSAFAASLVTIVREGVEVILVVAMLLALVSRAVQAGTGETEARQRAGRQGTRAIWLGVGLAIIASLATAAALNAMVATAQGRSREILEGLVMLVASCVLFYVSYWLVSQVEARRWMDFLKAQARRGLEFSGRGTLALTAFLAVFREGAETSLMYQALIGSEGRTRDGMLGLTAGLLAGLVILAVVALVIRATSIRLPIRAFFTLSGLFLFGLAIVFAGDAVFALQNAGLIKTTAIAWLGSGLPLVGLYPNVQAASVQGLMLSGAVAAWLLLPKEPAARIAA